MIFETVEISKDQVSAYNAIFIYVFAGSSPAGVFFFVTLIQCARWRGYGKRRRFVHLCWWSRNLPILLYPYLPVLLRIGINATICDNSFYYFVKFGCKVTLFFWHTQIFVEKNTNGCNLGGLQTL